MLKNGFLGRRDEPQTPAGGRASPDSPRYAPQPDAPLPSAVAVSHPAASSAPAGARATEVKSTTGTTGSDLLRETPAATTVAAPVSNAATTSGSTNGAPRLTVGPNIKLKGAEINDCDTLVVEGHVEASMDSKTLEILKTGSYAGTVTIDIAEIHGKFEGNPHRPQEADRARLGLRVGHRALRLTAGQRGRRGERRHRRHRWQGDSQGRCSPATRRPAPPPASWQEWNMSRRSQLRANLRRKLRRPGSANDSSAEPRARGSLLRRAQQWLAARERLLADWIARARVATALAHPACRRASDAAWQSHCQPSRRRWRHHGAAMVGIRKPAQAAAGAGGNAAPDVLGGAGRAGASPTGGRLRHMTQHFRPPVTMLSCQPAEPCWNPDARHQRRASLLTQGSIDEAAFVVPRVPLLFRTGGVAQRLRQLPARRHHAVMYATMVVHNPGPQWDKAKGRSSNPACGTSIITASCCRTASSRAGQAVHGFGWRRHDDPGGGAWRG